MSEWRTGTTQALAYTGSSAAVANVFGPQTRQVRLSATSACYYKVVDGTGGTAAATDVLLPFPWVDTIIVNPGQKIAAIQAPTGGLITGTAGTLSITELTR